MSRYHGRTVKKPLETILLSFLLSIFGMFIGSSNGTPTEVYAASAPKGGFYILDWGPLGKDYVSGGTALIDWRDFEPEEGVYRWELLKNPMARHIPWLEVFNARLRNREARIQPVPAQAVYSAHSAGKKVRLKLRVTEGAMPLWLYGGEDVNGKSPKSYGTTCGYPTYQEAWAGTPRCNAATDIVIAITMPLYPTKEDNAQPVWWNPIFQEKMKRVLKAIGDFVEKDPVYSSTVEFVEASVGSYGEMILYGKSDTFKFDTINQRMFRAAGYTNARYSEAVQKLIAVYMEAFPSFPIALSLGSGLYSGPYDDGSGVNSVPADVVSKVMSKYGSRIYLKFAGFGGNRADHTFRDYCPDKNRCIYESFGGITQWQIDGFEFPFFCHAEKYRASNCQIETPAKGAERLKKVLSYAVADKAYIIMMWYFDWRAIGDAPKKFRCADANGNEFDCTNSDWDKFDQAFAQVFPQLQSLASVNPQPPPTYQLIINKDGTGNGDVTGNMIHCGSTCTRAYPAGNSVTLTATASPGSEFAGWTGACSGTTPCALTMDRPQTVNVKFTLTAESLSNSASNLLSPDTGSISTPGGMTGNLSNSAQSHLEGNTANSLRAHQFESGTSPAYSSSVSLKLAAGAVVDLDGDGKDDVIWFEGESGPVWAWYFKGDRLTKRDIQRDVATPNWRMAGGGNLKQNGAFNIFWQNVVSGKVYAWSMSRENYLGEHYIHTVEDLQWKLAGAGDFDGDGNTDLLWHHQRTGAVYIWFMNGVNFTYDRAVAIVEDNRWQVVGVGDLNGDGKADILWQHPDGGPLYVWYMDGTKRLGDQIVREVEDLNWRVIGIGKFGESKKANILWRHQVSGEVYYWHLDGGTYMSDARVQIADAN